MESEEIVRSYSRRNKEINIDVRWGPIQRTWIGSDTLDLAGLCLAMSSIHTDKIVASLTPMNEDPLPIDGESAGKGATRGFYFSNQIHKREVNV
jgi:hypothetical protein